MISDFQLEMRTVLNGVCKYPYDLAMKYSEDLNGTDLCSEFIVFQTEILNLPLAQDSLKCIRGYSLKDVRPNVETALRIFQ